MGSLCRRPRVRGRQMPRTTTCEERPAGATGRAGLRGAAGGDLVPVPRGGTRRGAAAGAISEAQSAPITRRAASVLSPTDKWPQCRYAVARRGSRADLQRGDAAATRWPRARLSRERRSRAARRRRRMWAAPTSRGSRSFTHRCRRRPELVRRRRQRTGTAPRLRCRRRLPAADLVTGAVCRCPVRNR